jgi:hypothetical protein
VIVPPPPPHAANDDVNETRPTAPIRFNAARLEINCGLIHLLLELPLTV